MTPEDVDVQIAGNQLVISGEKKESSERKEQGLFQSECYYGSFHRTITVPEHVDPDRVTADYTHGVLTVHLKKTTPAAVKRVEVKTSGS